MQPSSLLRNPRQLRFAGRQAGGQLGASLPLLCLHLCIYGLQPLQCRHRSLILRQCQLLPSRGAWQGKAMAALGLCLRAK